VPSEETGFGKARSRGGSDELLGITSREDRGLAEVIEHIYPAPAFCSAGKKKAGHEEFHDADVLVRPFMSEVAGELCTAWPWRQVGEAWEAGQAGDGAEGLSDGKPGAFH
jgi:hypothetical protein